MKFIQMRTSPTPFAAYKEWILHKSALQNDQKQIQPIMIQQQKQETWKIGHKKEPNKDNTQHENGKHAAKHFQFKNPQLSIHSTGRDILRAHWHQLPINKPFTAACFLKEWALEEKCMENMSEEMRDQLDLLETKIRKCAERIAMRTSGLFVTYKVKSLRWFTKFTDVFPGDEYVRGYRSGVSAAACSSGPTQKYKPLKRKKSYSEIPLSLPSAQFVPQLESYISPLKHEKIALLTPKSVQHSAEATDRINDSSTVQEHASDKHGEILMDDIHLASEVLANLASNSDISPSSKPTSDASFNVSMANSRSQKYARAALQHSNNCHLSTMQHAEEIDNINYLSGHIYCSDRDHVLFDSHDQSFATHDRRTEKHAHQQLLLTEEQRRLLQTYEQQQQYLRLEHQYQQQLHQQHD